MNKTVKKLSLFLAGTALLFSLVGCNSKNAPKNPPNVTYKFTESNEGWTGDFADLPVDFNKGTYELEFKHSDIPVEDREDKGLLLKGHNRSDDLFMYITKKFDKEDGIEPNTIYEVDLSFDMATKVPGGMMGIGGSPGSSVYVKAGIINEEPKVQEDKNGYYRMNIDKANQSQDGKDMTVIGNVEKIDSIDESFQYKSFENLYEVTSNKDGEVWVIIGTDSGFEGLSELYYTNIKLLFNKVSE